MRLDAYQQQEAQRAAEQRADDRARGRPAVRIPGAVSQQSVANAQANVDRIQALAQLEREISAKRHDVLQLQRCASDPDLASRHAYACQHEAAAAVLRQMEARAEALRASAPD